MLVRSWLAIGLTLALLATPAGANPEAAEPAAETFAPEPLPVATLRIGLAWVGSGDGAVALEAAPYLKSDRTMVPLRMVAETMGANVSYDAQRRQVRVEQPGTSLVLTLGQRSAQVNGRTVSFDTAPELIADRTFVPIRLVAEGLGYRVYWEGETQTAIVSALGRDPNPADLERYGLQLVNLDRRANGLSAVAWDVTAARAGRGHAQDMAQHDYFSHWNREGQLPSYRYTQAGGQDAVAENLAKHFFLNASASFYQPPDFPRMVLHQARLMASPLHRRNILAPHHTHLGIGLAVGPHGASFMAQEFVDRYGVYDPLPRRATVGAQVRIAGTLALDARFYGISLARTTPRSMTIAELNEASTYSDPWPPYASYFSREYKTPIPVRVMGRDFEIEVPLSDEGRPGTYYVYIWATLDDGEPHPVSIRTIEVTQPQTPAP